MKYYIKFRGFSHPVQKRNIKAGTWMPAPCAIADKPFGTKGAPIPYDNAKLKELLLMNGNNMTVFRVVTRIGGFLFNSVSNKHLISFLGKLFGKLLWWTHNYIPYPLPKGMKAMAEKIYCDGNAVNVDKIVGQWAHLTAGTAYLTQVMMGSSARMNSNVRWKVPAGWVEKSLLVKA